MPRKRASVHSFWRAALDFPILLRPGQAKERRIAVKSIYFANRNPALKERFRPRWRRHAALAMSLPALWDLIDRYAQCDPVDEPLAALGITARYDAIGISWFRDLGAVGAAQETDAIRRLRSDELEIFEGPTRQVGFRCVETVRKDDGQGLFKIFSLTDCAPGISAEEFRTRLDGLAADLLAEPQLEGRLARLAVCLPLEGGKAGSGRRVQGMLELSFSRLADAAAFFSSQAYAAIVAAHPAIVEVERCATRELLLDDRALYD